ncbi:MAG TPA: MFS transporter [Thermoanaerobaculia bacterium]|nr:MFS transporter [Thermoanaerobaculia bacterium]
MESSSLKQLSVLMATVFVDMIGFLMVLPTVPYYAKDLGARPVVITMIISSFFLAQLITAPLWGRFSDRYGRRPAILVGLSSSAVAFALFGLANTIWLLFVFRLVQGAGGGTTGVVQAYVSDAVPPEERAKALGWISAATNAGVMIGGGIGSLAAHLGHWGPGFVAAGLCTLNVISAWLWLPESTRREPVVADAPKPVRRPLLQSVIAVLRHPWAPASSLIWIYTIGMMAFMGMNGVLALFLRAEYGVTVTTIGYFFMYIGAIGFVMRAVLLGPLVRRFGEVGVTRLGALFLVLGLAGIPVPAMLGLAPGLRLGLFAVVALLVPVGTALLFPATTALLSHNTSRAEMGQMMGVQQSFGSVARLIGPVCAGAIYEINPRYPFWAASALMLCTSFLTTRQKRTASEKKVPVDAPAG